MPACTTPELCPVWCWATRLSFSKTTTRVPGRRRTSSRPTASPMIPPPTMPTVSWSAISGAHVDRHEVVLTDADGQHGDHCCSWPCAPRRSHGSRQTGYVRPVAPSRTLAAPVLLGLALTLASCGTAPLA